MNNKDIAQMRTAMFRVPATAGQGKVNVVELLAMKLNSKLDSFAAYFRPGTRMKVQDALYATLLKHQCAAPKQSFAMEADLPVVTNELFSALMALYIEMQNANLEYVRDGGDALFQHEIDRIEATLALPNRQVDLKPESAVQGDDCEFCNGTSGGVRGNENIVEGKLMCDYCSAAAIKTAGLKAEPAVAGRVLSNEDLTRIYNEANGIGEGKNPPISTERIFAAMRASHALGTREAGVQVKRFEMQMLDSDGSKTTFTEQDAPDWLTSATTVRGSTMDQRWFWTDHVLTLAVGQSVSTEFRKITRIA